MKLVFFNVKFNCVFCKKKKIYVWTICSKTVFFIIFWWFLQINLNRFSRYIPYTRSISNKSFIVDIKSCFLSWNLLLVENSCDRWISSRKCYHVCELNNEISWKTAKGKNCRIILLLKSAFILSHRLDCAIN